MFKPIFETTNSRLALGIFVGLVSGFLHGYSGFAGGLLLSPLLAILYGPVEGIFASGVAGIAGSLQLLPRAIQNANWPEAAPAAILILLATPFGVVVLVSSDPELIRRAIGGFVLVIALIMMTGWVYRGPRGITGGSIAGLLSGAVTGATGAGGPIIVFYFLAAPESANVQRANIVICVATMITVVTVALAIGGDISAAAFWRAIVIGVVYLLGAWAGGWLFEKTPASWFRPAVLWILVATGIGVLIV